MPTLRDYLRAQSATLLRRLAQQVRRAKRKLDEDSVHDLRVSIRRLTEFLRTFEALYPKGAVEVIRKEIRKIMKGAEKLRSADIALDLLEKSELPKTHALLEKLRGQREMDERVLLHDLKTLADHPYPKIWSQALHLDAKHHSASRAEEEWRDTESAAANARRVLPQILHAYFKKGRKLSAESKPKAMHRFRLRTKHLRYTLDIFLPLYGSALKKHIEALRPIQKALGEFNDCEVLLDEMDGELPKTVGKFVKARAVEKRKTFLDYWKTEFDAPGEDRKWVLELTRAPRKAK